MKTAGLGCAVALLLLGCTNSLLRQPKPTAAAAPPVAASVPKARPDAPVAAPATARQRVR